MRRSLVLLLTVVAAAALVACGGDDDDTTPAMADDHMDHGDNSPVAEGAREIPVTASSFQFEPAELHARVGENLAIALTATDILHDFTIDELDTHVAAEPGETARGGVVAESAGRYTYYCTVAGHRQAGMEGVLMVE